MPVEEQKPTCIFVAIGSGKFLYNMALTLSKDYDLPIFTYVCDDFYFMKAPKSFFGPIWKKAIVNKSKKLFENTKEIISICDELSLAYAKEFNKPAVTVMTGTNYHVTNEIVCRNSVKTIRYFGKLSLNRYKSIADICRVLDEINAEENTDYSVEIFCGELDEDIKREFSGIRSAAFYDFITGDKFRETFFSSDALLHIEGFDEASVDRVKYSVSTKIADSLASGIPLFAYGPENVASIQHIIRNDSGIVATNKGELKEKLQLLFTDRSERAKVSAREIEAAKKYHDPNRVSRALYEVLSDRASSE